MNLTVMPDPIVVQPAVGSWSCTSKCRSIDWVTLGDVTMHVKSSGVELRPVSRIDLRDIPDRWNCEPESLGRFSHWLTSNQWFPTC